MKNNNLSFITVLSALIILLPSLCKSHEIKEDTIRKIIQKFIINNPDLIRSSLDNHKINQEKQILNCKGIFTVNAADYNIEIPKIVRNKVNDKVTIDIEFQLIKKSD